MSTSRPTQATRNLTVRRLLLAGALGLFVPGLVDAQPTTTRVSVGPGGAQGNGNSTFAVISADGHWVVFYSDATNLVPGDTNLRSDVFVHHRPTGTTTRVSVGPGGTQGNGSSGFPATSADARWVAFHSVASNLVTADTNGYDDVFVHDRQTGATTRVSVGTGGIQGNGDTRIPAISADGRWVAFESEASNLVASDTNSYEDVFVHDRQTGTTTRVSVGPGGAQGNGQSATTAISADGRWVVFNSFASNLVPGDTNGSSDVFVHDRQTGITTRVSVGPGGAQGNSWSVTPAISVDGGWVAFVSAASNLVAADTNGMPDVFVHNRQTGTTTRVSVGSGGAQGNARSGEHPAISHDGRWVAFESEASNLVPGDTNGARDVFVHDGQTGITARVSVGPGGDQGIDDSWFPAMSADGLQVAFASYASNLVAGDTNRTWDVFVHDRGDAGCVVSLTPISASAPAAGAMGNLLVLASTACAWTAVSNDPSWLTVTSGSSGTGNGTVSYSVAANAGGPRTGTITIAGQTFTVNQATGPPPPPITAPDAYATPFNMPLVVAAPGVLANDNSNGGAMAAALVGIPASGTVALDASGAFTYTPNLGFSGADAFTYRAVTGSGPGNVATVSVTVAAAMTPLPPVGLAAHSVFGNIVTLRWTIPAAGPAPTSFLLEGGVNLGDVLASLPTGSPVPTFTFTAPTGSFYLRMHALNGALRSAASNEIRIHVNVPVPPSAPANLLGLVNGSTLALAWTNTYAGGAPTSLVLDVTGSIVTSLPLGFRDSFSFADVPGGIYTLSLRAQNAGGTSPPSNAVTLTFPGPCSGPPLVPSNVLAYRVGSTVFVDWAPGTSGPAPTQYVLNVTGSFVGSFVTMGRAMSGTVGSGSYNLSVIAANSCGASAGSPPQTVVVP